jgi:GDP-L-fucose synthase
MDPQSKIYIAGHTGLVGSAIARNLAGKNYSNIIGRTIAELDLTDQAAVRRYFETERPEYVFLAAAKVGGIQANNTYPAEFIYSNLVIQNNIIHTAWQYGVKKLLFLGSSCIYPKYCPQPIKEEYLLTGALEPTNEAYAVAKIAGLKMCQYYNKQYGTHFISAMPTNLYGPYDNFDPENSHVLPALLRRIHEAKLSDQPAVTIWGSGAPRREFLYVDDLADACVFLMENYNEVEIVNIGTGQDLTIRELAESIREVAGYRGDFIFDTSKPDGTPQKLLDVSRLTGLGWRARIGLRAGIQKTYEWYVKSINN